MPCLNFRHRNVSIIKCCFKLVSSGIIFYATVANRIPAIGFQGNYSTHKLKTGPSKAGSQDRTDWDSTWLHPMITSGFGTLPSFMGLIRGLGRSLDKGMAIHSSVHAWRIPWTEEPVRLQSMGSQRVGNGWVTKEQLPDTVLRLWRWILISNGFKLLLFYLSVVWFWTKRHF